MTQLDDDFDRIVDRLDPAMVVVTTAHGDERAGCLVGFHSQCSLEPRRLAVWLSKTNHTFRVATLAETLAVHYLGPEHRALAALFGGTTGDAVDKFSRCAWEPGPDGVPLLGECANRVVGRKLGLVDAADCDHVCVLLAPVAVDADGALDPLPLRAVEDIEPGHQAGERPTGPSLRDRQ